MREEMITDCQIQRRDGLLILGIAIDNALLDVVTDVTRLAECLAMLRLPYLGLVSARMGHFGDFAVTVNLFDDDRVSIFIDGPQFEIGRTQSAAIYVDKEGLCKVIETAING
jgi:hypothetical protein